MMRLMSELLRDEQGFILSAETVLLGTVGVIGATVGLSAVSRSVNDELTEVALAFRSLDQSFEIEGSANCGACIAGSKYKQQPVELSLKQLCDGIEQARHQERRETEEAQQHLEKRLQEERQSREKHEAERRHEMERHDKEHHDKERHEAERREMERNREREQKQPDMKKPESKKPEKNRKPKDEEISI